MPDLTPEQLAELRRLHEAATPGEWQTNAVPSLGSEANGVFTKPPNDDDPEIFVCSVKPRWEEGCAVGEEAIANARAIAALHNAAPQLLAAAEAHLALTQRLADLEQEWRESRFRSSIGPAHGLGFNEGMKAAADELAKLKETK